MASHVLQDDFPSAPSEGVVPEQQYTPLYPTLPSWETLPNAKTFRLGEISKIEKQISDESEHYRLVLKKYKKAQTATSYVIAGLGVATTALSSGVIASALTGVGTIASVRLGIVSGLCGIVSTVLMGASKKLAKKVNKHSRLCSLADNKVSDSEFKHITHEMNNYADMKESLRLKFTKKPSDSPDINKIRDEIRKEFRKKIAATSTALN